MVLKKVREDHNINKKTNGLEAWIVSAPWGLGVRFYPVGSGYPGMIDSKEIKLVERL